MTYECIKTIRGRKYRYEQRSYREDGRVRTESKYLGPVDGTPRRGNGPGFMLRNVDWGATLFSGERDYENEKPTAPSNPAAPSPAPSEPAPHAEPDQSAPAESQSGQQDGQSPGDASEGETSP